LPITSKRSFLVSDNDAYNRLYEFDGQETLNRSLWQKGYNDVRIVRRFVTATEEENRHTNAIRFDKKNTVYPSHLHTIPSLLITANSYWLVKDISTVMIH
jgi:hypothetical protein